MKQSVYSTKKVLLVEDNQFERQIVLMLLRQIGFNHLVEAPGGREGLELATKHQPDLIICDIEMEPVNGLEFLELLRADSARFGITAPVIFLTQHSDSSTVTNAKSLGIDAFIVKPPSLSALKTKIDWILDTEDWKDR